MGDFEVIRGTRGRGLVRDGRRAYSVPETLAQELAAAGDDARARWRSLVGEPSGSPMGRAFRSRLVLLSASRADAVARRLAPLAGGRGLIALAAIGGLGLGAARCMARPRVAADTAEVAVGIGLFLATAFWHEFGHAAALRREGLPSGRIGGGLLWVLPVLTCDVTAASLLPRHGRLRVDGAGMVFQFAAAGVLAGIGSWWVPARYGSACALMAVAWNAAPLLRTDGHWLLLDALGLPDLVARPPEDWPRSRRALLAAWRCATGILLVAAAILLPWRLAAWLSTVAGVPSTFLRGVVWLLAAFIGWRAGRRAWSLFRAGMRDRR